MIVGDGVLDVPQCAGPYCTGMSGRSSSILLKEGAIMSTKLHSVLSIRLFREDKCFGSGIAQLLRGVQTHHSLRAAAMEMGMAYSKAWTIMRNCEAQLGFPLLNSTTGGKHGGGASLTPEAEQLLDAYERYCKKLRQAADRLFAEEFEAFL